MRTFLTLVTLFYSIGSLAAEEKFDLLGPGLSKGDSYLSKTTFEMQNADFNLSIQGQEAKGTMSLEGTAQQTTKVLAAEGRKVTKTLTHIRKDTTKRSVTVFGNTEKDTEEDPLAGTTIISELKDGKWKSSLIEAIPSEKQEKQLAKFSPIEDDSLIYPKEKVAVGHTWEIKAEDYAKATGAEDLEDVEGTMKATFKKVVEFQGEKCALIEVSVDLKGTMKDDEQNGKMTIKGAFTVHRSLKTGMDLKGVLDGTMTLDAKVEGGAKMNVSGKVRFTGGYNLD